MKAILTTINIVNRQTAYRLEALLELAHAHPAPVRVAELARRRGIPRPFLARLLTDLAHQWGCPHRAGPSRRGVPGPAPGPRVPG